MQTTLVVPLLGEIDTRERIPESTRHLQESVITGRDSRTNHVLSTDEYLQVLDDLRGIHQQTVAAVAKVFAAALHAKHFRTDHPRIVEQRVYGDARALPWGIKPRSVAQSFSDLSNVIPSDIAAHLSPVSAEKGGETTAEIIAHAIARSREYIESFPTIFFVSEDIGKLPSDAYDVLTQDGAPQMLLWDAHTVAHHYLSHRKNELLLPSERFMLDAITMAS